MYRTNYPVDNISDYWKISLCLVFLGHLVEEILKRVASIKERLGGSYLYQVSLLNLTPEIVDRLLSKENILCG